MGVLKPLIMLTEQFSLETNVSLSATIPMLSNLKKRVMMPNPDDSPAIRDLKKAITTDIDTRWNLKEFEPQSLYLMAAALDPRFKCLRFLKEEERDRVYIQVGQINIEDFICKNR